MSASENTTAQVDLESGESDKQNNFSNLLHLLEAAALLIIWSILVINEGSIRIVDIDPAQGLSGGRPNRTVVFVAGVFELIFGLVGLFVGLAAFAFRTHRESRTKSIMLLQTILGYYVFVVYVFVIPAFKAADLTEPSLEGLSLGQTRFLIALGILTSFHFCLALQGGQFVFMSRLVAASTGKDFLKQKSGSRMRAIFWSANLFFAGLWTAITGIMLRVNVGNGKLDMPFEFPPHVGRLPANTVTVGFQMMVLATFGIVVAIYKFRIPAYYYYATAFVYISALLNFGVVQFGQIKEAASGSVAFHNGLVFVTVFLGPYFLHVASRKDEDGN